MDTYSHVLPAHSLIAVLRTPLTPVSALQCLVNSCELELSYLDMLINIKKSCCMLIGPRHNVQCSNITTISGQVIPWVDSVRYL